MIFSRNGMVHLPILYEWLKKSERSKVKDYDLLYSVVDFTEKKFYEPPYEVHVIVYVLFNWQIICVEKIIRRN